MQKTELLKMIDAGLIERLYQYCYARTSYSCEAEELCSDILYAVVRSGRGGGEVENPEGYFWGIAHRVYADYCERRSVRGERTVTGDAEEVLGLIPDTSEERAAESEEDARLLGEVLRQITFLSKAYRDVMVGFYLEGKSTARLAAELCISETAVRQRLFAARNDVRNEVKKMGETNKIQKPTALEKISFGQWGDGNPNDGNPWTLCERQLSRHVIWLCRNNPTTAKAISDEMGVPMPYIEEELVLQVRGKNGRYGTIRKTDSGKYVTNFILLDDGEIKEAGQFYMDRISMICDAVAAYIEAHREEYLSLSYLNKMPTFNLILWQNVKMMAEIFAYCVETKLQDKYFPDVEIAKRPYTIYGYRWYEGRKNWGAGQDSIEAEGIGGYKKILLMNIYMNGIQAHFRCGHDIYRDPALTMAIRAVEGISMGELDEKGKEIAAKAIECGYLYRDGDVLYTKFLVSRMEDEGRVWSINKGMASAFEEEADKVASQIAGFIRKNIPEHLMGDYLKVNSLAGEAVVDFLVEALIQRGLLTPPADGVGAEGLWMFVEK